MLGIASACFFGLLSVLSMIYYHAAAWFFIVGLAVSLAIALWRWLTEKAHLTKQQRIWSSLSFGLSVCGLGWILMLWVPLNMATYTGVLISPKTAERQLEIGNGGTILKILDGKPGGPLFTFFDKTNLTIEAEKGKLKVSTIVYDRNGRIAVELIKNKWKIAPPPGTWDRNYSDDALEVKDDTGDVILQIRMLKDRIQLQAVYYDGPESGVAIMQNYAPERGGIIDPFDPQKKRVGKIRPIFVYPSETHLGEFRGD